MTQENDIVLIYFEDNPLMFARIEDIQADIKPNWYHVKLMILQVPVQLVTWILRDAYINGDEFTMNGKRMRLEKVICPEESFEETEENSLPVQDNSTKKSEKKEEAKVISFADIKKQ